MTTDTRTAELAAATKVDLWWTMLDNLVDLNGGDVEASGNTEYLRGGFEVLRDACPYGEDSDERGAITAALIYAHPHWNGGRPHPHVI